MNTAKQVKILVLDLPHVANPQPSTIQELRNLVCDGWLYGFKDGSKFNEGEHDKMQAYITEAAKQLKRAA
jgi:hypothetical protein